MSSRLLWPRERLRNDEPEEVLELVVVVIAVDESKIDEARGPFEFD